MGRAFRIAVALCAALALAGCGGKSASYRYKLTLSVETPDGVKTASNVVEEDVISAAPCIECPVIEGQALYLDLGPGRRPLVALLNPVKRANENSTDPRRRSKAVKWVEMWPQSVLGKACLGAKRSRKLDAIGLTEALKAECRQSFSITLGDLPDLVTFADVNDPKSVSWKAMTLQVTDDSLTTGIEWRLPWLKALGGVKHLDGSEGDEGPDAPIANRLQQYNFENVRGGF
jgi:hypothetical protein